jgi:hypothetical protein
VGVFALAHDTPAASAAALARQKEIDVIVAPAEGRESLHWTVTRMGSGDGDLVPAEELVAWLTREASTT